MLTAVAVLRRLSWEVLQSFGEWPGYEQQYGSERPKQVRNVG